MRVALLISGEPRFCREFDLFLDHLRGHGTVDWFVWLWQGSQSEGDSRGLDVVAPCWRHLDYQTAHNRLTQLMPSNHTLARLTIADRLQYPPPTVHNKAGETSVERMWGMYSSLYQCDLSRRAHEQNLAQPYDLVVRIRPDLGLNAPLDLVQYKQLVTENPSTVITASNHIHGYGHRINDMMAIGNSTAMSTYCDLAQHIVDYHDRDHIIFHPETMLAYHLKQQGLVSRELYEVVLRQFGSVVDDAYRSDYGRWA
jgi:hypothetical protein